jgi:hypothetical protein
MSLNEHTYKKSIQAPPESNLFTECIAFFDSTIGAPYSDGYIFKLDKPHPGIIGFKFTGATIFNNLVVNNHSVCYITCDLMKSSFPSYANNTSGPFLACIPLTTTGPVNLYCSNYPCIMSGIHSSETIVFSLRDRLMAPIKNIPFIVTITLIIAK